MLSPAEGVRPYVRTSHQLDTPSLSYCQRPMLGFFFVSFLSFSRGVGVWDGVGKVVKKAPLPACVHVCPAFTTLLARLFSN